MRFAHFDNATKVHHCNSIADVLDDAEIVCNEEVGETELLLQVLQQIQHLRLH